MTALAGALAGDGRIGGRFLSPGLGYGGGCLPKDVRAFAAAAGQLGIESLAVLLGEIDAINLRCRTRTVSLARRAAGGSLDGCRAAVLGVAFKPGSDDVRDSASLDVCCRLAAEGAHVTVHDPVAAASAARLRPDLRYAASVMEAVRRRRPRPAPHRMAGIPADRPGHPQRRSRPAQHHRRPVRSR